MADEIQPDMACVPYRRKGLYYALTIPFLALLVVVLVYLWTFSFVLSLVFALFFFLMSLFHSHKFFIIPAVKFSFHHVVKVTIKLNIIVLCKYSDGVNVFRPASVIIKIIVIKRSDQL